MRPKSAKTSKPGTPVKALPPLSTSAELPRRGRPTAEQAAAISRSILSAGTKLFLADGFEQTTMDAVAARAGIPRSTLYKRFADKRALLREVIAERVEQWSRINSRKNWMLSGDLEQRLERYAAWILTWATNPEFSAVARLAAHAWPGATEVKERLDVLGWSRMVDLLTDEIASFTNGRVVDPSRVALTLMAMIAGWLTFRSDDRPLSDDEACDCAGYLVSVLCRGQEGW